MSVTWQLKLRKSEYFSKSWIEKKTTVVMRLIMLDNYSLYVLTSFPLILHSVDVHRH
jgi:hypothetical protein